MALARCVSKDLSDKDFEYPETTVPEQGLKQKIFQKTCMSLKTSTSDKTSSSEL